MTSKGLSASGNRTETTSSPSASGPSRPYMPRDPATLPKHFEAADVEAQWQARWHDAQVYAYDPSRPREESFVVDTPPPTVSGSLHVGHVFSYTHTDLLVRYKRMRGMNIFYPMGWDDNGLPTERRVQNLYHVRCDPNVPFDPALQLSLADAARKKERPALISRRNFIALCHEVTKQDEEAFLGLWRHLGLSVDWAQQYATMDDRCREVAQRSFLDLASKGEVYSEEAPTMWDVDFQTAVAQAELEDRPKRGAFHRIAFGVRDAGEAPGHFVIATTRPELLAACVGVTAHPEDPRYKALFGKTAITPVFQAPVPIFPSELADPEKGTGILMVCTFGDATDVHWWRTHGLALRQVLDRAGRFAPKRFVTASGRFESVSSDEAHATSEPRKPVRDGEALRATGHERGPGEEQFVSLLPDAANAAYTTLVGKTVHSARALIVEMLGDPMHASLPLLEASSWPEGLMRAPLQGEPEPTEQAVKFFEKGDKPLEFITTRQWFVRLLDKKDALLKLGKGITWHPPYMGQRLDMWTENLALDWCISRQRYFGVPFPVWYRLDAEGMRDNTRPIFANLSQLPLDPMADVPEGFDESQRNQPHGFVGEPDVFDTWFTSSMTPMIGSGWGKDASRHQRLFPADVRPQSHEIIRTWAFYTLAKAWLHEGTLPWKHVVISGWVLDPERKKMSKSKGNVITPTHMLETHGADAVRYWAASARLGADTTFDEQVIKIGRRLVTKLYNAGKFVLQQSGSTLPPDLWFGSSLRDAIVHPLDRGLLGGLSELVRRTEQHFDSFEFAKALHETETFFWTQFTDAYLELSKGRARSESDAAGRDSAVATLRETLGVLTRLFAPFLPYITEEIWSWSYAASSGYGSVHQALWPRSDKSLDDALAPEENPKTLGQTDASGEKRNVFSWASQAMRLVHKCKSDAGASTGRPLLALTLVHHPEDKALARGAVSDLALALRVPTIELQEDAAVAPGSCAVMHCDIEDNAT